jgi:20S proteasome alpha/beta subunit
MTMCLGVNLGDAVVLAADGRRTMSSGERVDDVQKLVKITDTLWSAGAGNLPLTTYIQGVLAERAPDDVGLYLKAAIQPFAQAAFQAHTALFERLAYGQPTLANYTVASMLLVGGFDRASGGAVLFSLSFADGFEPLLRVSACIGGRLEDQQRAAMVMRPALATLPITPERVADACRDALQAVAKVNPEIGPTGHVVIVRRTGFELRAFD